MLVNTSWGFTNFLNFFQTQRSWTKRLPKQTASVYFQINNWLRVFKKKNKQKPGLIVAESYWLDISATEIKNEKFGSLGFTSFIDLLKRDLAARVGGRGGGGGGEGHT